MIEKRYRIRLEKYCELKSQKRLSETQIKLEKWARFEESLIKHGYLENGTCLLILFKQITNMLLSEKDFTYNLNLDNHSVGSLALQAVSHLKIRKIKKRKLALTYFFFF